jgi:hypothetical protein
LKRILIQEANPAKNLFFDNDQHLLRTMFYLFFQKNFPATFHQLFPTPLLGEIPTSIINFQRLVFPFLGHIEKFSGHFQALERSGLITVGVSPNPKNHIRKLGDVIHFTGSFFLNRNSLSSSRDANPVIALA